MNPFPFRTYETLSGDVLTCAMFLGFAKLQGRRKNLVTLTKDIQNPKVDPLLVVTCSVPVMITLPNGEFPFPSELTILTDLQCWLPLIKRTKVVYKTYDKITKSDPMYKLLAMDRRDLRKIATCVLSASDR